MIIYIYYSSKIFVNVQDSHRYDIVIGIVCSYHVDFHGTQAMLGSQVFIINPLH